MKADHKTPGPRCAGRTPNEDARAPAPVDGLVRKRKLALAALVAMVFIWGYNWVVLKKVLDYAGPFDFTALRTLAAAVVLLLVTSFRGRVVDRSLIRAWPRVLLLGVLQTGLFSLFLQIALLWGGASKTSLLVYTMPFWVVPMAWIAFGERIRGLQWLALAVAGLGLVVVFQPWSAGHHVLSEALAIGSGLCWAMGTIVAKWIRRDYDLDVLQLTAWQTMGGALVLCLFVWMVPERPIDPSPYFYFALIYNAVLSTGLAWFLWLFALQYLSSGVAGMMALGVPVVSGLAALIELGETPSSVELAGMGLILSGLVILSLRSLVRKR